MSTMLPEVRVGEVNRNSSNIGRFVEKAREILLPALGRDIVLSSYDRGVNRPPLADGNFYVYIWASVSGSHSSGNSHRSTRLFGLDIGPTDWNWHGFSGQGKDLREPENHAIVAELVGDNLYIFPPINDERLARIGPDIFGHILRVLVESGELDGPVLPEERAARIRALRKDQFINLCGSRLFRNVQATESTVHEKSVRLEAFRTRLLNGFLQLQAARGRLHRPTEPVDGEKFGREFDGLLRVPKVRRVVVKDRKVEVYTDTIYCRDPRSKKLHELGKFRICVDVFGGEVRWFNITRRINAHKKNMHAPHVFDGGQACLGSAAETLAELLSSFEISATVMYAIQFLESVNVDDDSGRHVDQWPLAADQSAA